MRTKLRQVYSESLKCEYDVIVIVETWLNEDFLDEEIFSSNLYMIYRKDRDYVKTNCVKGGGVLIAVKKSLISALCGLNNADSLVDQLCVSINGSKGKLYIFVSYIPPNSSEFLYDIHIQNIIYLVSDVNNVIVFGDFNLSKVVWTFDPYLKVMTPSNINSSFEMNVIDGLFSLNLVQVNEFFNALNKILDLVFIDPDLNFFIRESLQPFYRSDMHHKALEINVEFYSFPKVTHYEYGIDFKKCNFHTINNLIQEVSWPCLFKNFNVTECYDIFINTINQICFDNIPLLKPRIYKLPWYTKGLKKLKNKRNKYYKRYRASNSLHDKNLYEQYLREFNFLNKFLYKQYILSFEVNIKSDPKSFWNFINSKKTRSNYPSEMKFYDKVSNTPDETANLFADFFSANFGSGDSTGYCSDTFNNVPLNFGKLQLSEDDILQGFCKLKRTYRNDCDNLCSYFIKGCSSSLAVPLLFIFNKSLHESVFVDRWKICSITPVFKSGSKDNICNYRPIAKLSNISKLFEHIMSEKIYFSVKSILSSSQHGFVKGRSTITNLAIFSQYCISNFELGYQVDTVYTDLSKAFDKVSHTILIKKLSNLGFHSNVLCWLKSYLTSRRCFVSIDSYVSYDYIASSGVPQGSILGPLLFLLFINDISYSLKWSKVLLYADDLKIFMRIKSIADCVRLQCDLNTISQWCSNNCLEINIAKCSKVSYGRIKNFICYDYMINAQKVNVLNEVKDLGVIFDAKFTFVSHLNYIIPKAYSLLAFVKRNCRDFLDPYTVKTVYTSLIRSKLEYACFIWNPFCTKHSVRIERIQKRFIKFALHSINFNHPEPSYIEKCRLISLKSLENRRLMLSQLFLYKISNGLVQCSELLEMLSFNVPCRTLRINNFFFIPFHRTNYCYHEPIIRALREFNRNNSLDLDFSTSFSLFSNVLDLIYF